MLICAISGTCKNGTGKVGCGPQEEFRACSDVTITDEDGSANSAPNNDVDIFQKDETENEINEIENSIGWEHSHSDDNTEQRSAEGIVIIVLASLLTAVLMFGAIFLYYYKARDSVKTVMKERSLKMPKVTIPKLKALKPSCVKSFCKLDKLGKLN